VEKVFKHQYAAHCESGVVSSLLRHHGIDISEAMAFGISSSINFAYIPFVKLGGLPLIAYRMPPKFILKGVEKSLGFSFRYETFRNQEKGMTRLDELLANSEVVGAQTSVYWLPYFPEDMRFHFNAHNLLIYGKEGDEYLISDPVGEEPVRCEASALQKARFAKGVLAPKGLIYYMDRVPGNIDLRAAIPKAIKKTCRIILKAPLFFIGTKGIRYTAKQVEKQAKKPLDEGKLFVGHIVRMQEEIGTGGAGFRFIYASFLQEAANLLQNDELQKCSEELTEIGDQWRMFALNAAKMCKGRQEMDYALLGQQLRQCADLEQNFFQRLSHVSFK